MHAHLAPSPAGMHASLRPPHAPRRQVRGNALLVCDRAVARVLLAYFDDIHGGADDLSNLPNKEVHPGVIELRRSHSGFSVTHTSLDRGEVSRVAGPGTNLEGQTANRLPPSPPSMPHGVSSPAVMQSSAALGMGVPRQHTAP